jgi:hypothetical protein
MRVIRFLPLSLGEGKSSCGEIELLELKDLNIA